MWLSAHKCNCSHSGLFFFSAIWCRFIEIFVKCIFMHFSCFNVNLVRQHLLCGCYCCGDHIFIFCFFFSLFTPVWIGLVWCYAPLRWILTWTAFFLWANRFTANLNFPPCFIVELTTSNYLNGCYGGFRWAARWEWVQCAS